MKTKFSNHEAVRLQFMTQSVNSLLSGENCLKQRKSTYDKRFIRYHKCFLLKLRYGAHANSVGCLTFLMITASYSLRQNTSYILLLPLPLPMSFRSCRILSLQHRSQCTPTMRGICRRYKSIATPPRHKF